jgi:hypothetical protein
MVRRYQVEDGHPRQCGQPGCDWVRVHVDPALCSKHLGQYRRGTLGQTAGAIRHKNDPNWLADDGIIDELAVEIAAQGTRVVRLTTRERLRVAQRILRHGGNSRTIADRCGVPGSMAVRLMNKAEQGILDAEF